MDFLEGTLHIFLIYLVLFLIFCVPPYFTWWERLVAGLNRVELKGAHLAAVFYPVAAALLIFSIVITHLFQYHKETGVNFHYHFAPASFIVIPLVTAFFGVTAWERARKRVGAGDLGVLLFCYGGFGVAGTNIHDVLWCGRATDLYTRLAIAGNDLSPWVELVRAPTHDYRMFGFYMLIQTLLGLAIAHVTYFRFLKIKQLDRRLGPLLWAWLGGLALAFAITLIDWPHLITPPLLHTSTIGAGLIAACALFHQSGRSL